MRKTWQGIKTDLWDVRNCISFLQLGNIMGWAGIRKDGSKLQQHVWYSNRCSIPSCLSCTRWEHHHTTNAEWWCVHHQTNHHTNQRKNITKWIRISSPYHITHHHVFFNVNNLFECYSTHMPKPRKVISMSYRITVTPWIYYSATMNSS